MVENIEQAIEKFEAKLEKLERLRGDVINVSGRLKQVEKEHSTMRVEVRDFHDHVVRARFIAYAVCFCIASLWIVVIIKFVFDRA